MTRLLKQRLQVLFCGLLAVKTELVMEGFASPCELFGEPVVGLGLSHPLPGHSFHRGPCPWQQSPAGTNLLPSDARSSFAVSGQSDQAEREGRARDRCAWPVRAGFALA